MGPIFFLLLLAQPVTAGVALHGFLQGNYNLNTASANPDGRDSKLAEERVQLKLEADQSSFRFLLKSDFAWDHLDEAVDLELREGFADYTAAAWDLRLGRQVVTWGLGDLVFINDVFPKDYEAFFAGRPLEYLKKGVDGARLGLYPGPTSFEIIAIPWFTANHYPDPGRYWLHDPLPLVAERTTSEPSPGLANTELALRVYGAIGGFDLSFYSYRGFFRQPAIRLDPAEAPARLTYWYPRLAVHGASLQTGALAGVVSLEGGYYDSRDDRAGNDPLTPNSQVRWLLGYQRQLWEDFTVGCQYYGERMLDYGSYTATLPAGMPGERRLHNLVSLRLTQLLLHQTLKLSFFAFLDPDAGDYLLNPELKYNFTDRVWGALGGNFFGGGEAWGQFGQLERNDNLYLQMRYEL